MGEVRAVRGGAAWIAVIIVLGACKSNDGGGGFNAGIIGAGGDGAAGFAGASVLPTAGTSGGGVIGTAGIGTGGIVSVASGGVSGSTVIPGTGGVTPLAGMGGRGGAGGSTIGVGGAAGGGGARAGAGGASGAAGGAPGTATFAQVTSILNMRCGSCHGTTRRPTLTTNGATLYMTLTSTSVSQCGSDKLITASDPANSAVLELVQRQCGTFVMPRGCSATPCIAATEIQTITAWVQAGAPMM